MSNQEWQQISKGNSEIQLNATFERLTGSRSNVREYADKKGFEIISSDLLDFQGGKKKRLISEPLLKKIKLEKKHGTTNLVSLVLSLVLENLSQEEEQEEVVKALLLFHKERRDERPILVPRYPEWYQKICHHEWQNADHKMNSGQVVPRKRCKNCGKLSLIRK